ncbi:ABC transporter permease [Chengkuizengella sp. SCS-71B]|uniref:ABC transporter permease n=1 Tax=Chengkuizengella sp. SCS-71B TaxID=3115290 RepID=UPI0032C23FFE
MKRLISEIEFQWNVFKLVVDWIVALYFVLPLLIFIGYQHVSWWLKIPFWLENIPLLLFLAIIYFLFLASGRLRTFLEDGDHLFLIQYHKWINTIRTWGIVYSIIFHFIIILFVYVFLSPLFIYHYDFTVNQLISLFLFSVLTKLFIIISKDLLFFRFKKWRQFIVSSLLFILGGIGYILIVLKCMNYIWIFIPLLFMIILLFMIKRLHKEGIFLDEVYLEQEAKMKFISMVLKDHVKKRWFKWLPRNKPILFRQSRQLFKKRTIVNVLVESNIKAFVRDSRMISNLLQYTFLSINVLWIAPYVMKWFIWIAIIIIMAVWIKNATLYTKNNSFIEFLSWNDNLPFYEVIRKTIFILITPWYLFMSSVFGLILFSWWSIPVILGSFFICYFISYVLYLSSS